MKISLVSPYDFAYPGGVNNHICSLERRLTEMGHRVKVIAPASGPISSFDDRFIPIGKPVPIPACGSIARITLSPRLSSTVKAVLKEENFDIIHLHEPFMLMLPVTVLNLSHTANVGTFHAFHGTPSYGFLKPISTIFLKKWFKKLDGKIAVSKPAMEFVCKHLPGNYDIIPNGVDLDRFSPDVPPIDEFCDGKLNILFVGRVEKRKGLTYLLNAYKRVKQEISNSRLIVVGSGTRLRHKYEERVMRNRLKDVIFVGYVPYNELLRYYKTADIFCAPATGQESFGIVLLEAMAAGKPIVASNIEGYASVVTHCVEGLLVPPRNDEMLAQALIHLMVDKSLREQMGANGRVKAEEYSWERVAQNVLDCYVRVLSNSLTP